MINNLNFQAFKDSSVLELRYRPSNPFCHPINGEIMKTVNPLLKITRRRKKAKPGEPPNEWEISYKIVGVVTKVGRFRGNFQIMITIIITIIIIFLYEQNCIKIDNFI